MSDLAFMSLERCGPEVPLASPVAAVLVAGAAAVREVRGLAVLELRGDLELASVGEGEELIRITPRRGLLLAQGASSGVLERLRGGSLRAYDVTGAIVVLEVEGEQLFRRLTDLDPEALPAVGPIARGVAAVAQRRGSTFRLLVPQELARYVAEVALDAVEGLRP